MESRTGMVDSGKGNYLWLLRPLPASRAKAVLLSLVRKQTTYTYLIIFIIFFLPDVCGWWFRKEVKTFWELITSPYSPSSDEAENACADQEAGRLPSVPVKAHRTEPRPLGNASRALGTGKFIKNVNNCNDCMWLSLEHFALALKCVEKQDCKCHNYFKI